MVALLPGLLASCLPRPELFQTDLAITIFIDCAEFGFGHAGLFGLHAGHAEVPTPAEPSCFQGIVCRLLAAALDLGHCCDRAGSYLTITFTRRGFFAFKPKKEKMMISKFERMLVSMKRYARASLIVSR